MSPKPELRLLHNRDGEVIETTPEGLEAEVLKLRDEVRGLQRDIRGWTHRYHELQRDKEAEAEADPHWPAAIRIFGYWQEECKHPRAEWTLDRFELILPFLKRRKYGVEACLRAIAGAAYDPYISTRKNGSAWRHDDFELIFGPKFESFANRAPKGWKSPTGL